MIQHVRKLAGDDLLASIIKAQRNKVCPQFDEMWLSEAYHMSRGVILIGRYQ